MNKARNTLFAIAALLIAPFGALAQEAVVQPVADQQAAVIAPAPAVAVAPPILQVGAYVFATERIPNVPSPSRSFPNLGPTYLIINVESISDERVTGTVRSGDNRSTCPGPYPITRSVVSPGRVELISEGQENGVLLGCHRKVTFLSNGGVTVDNGSGHFDGTITRK